MDINLIENLNFKHVIDRGTGRIIVHTEKELIVFDERSKTLMIACDDAHEGLEELDKIDMSDIFLVLTSNLKLGNLIYDKYKFTGKMNCYQVAYLQKGVPLLDGELSFREATLDDFSFIISEYNHISEEDIKKAIERKNIIIGYKDGKAVGFIGEHQEGSMGMLQVLSDYRRCGYGQELEKEMISRTISKGFIPFAQIVEDNTASICLQKKLGLSKSDNLIMWMWK